MQKKTRLPKTKPSKNNLAGITAFAGKAKGRVCVIKNSSDVKNFKKGDILVMSTTSPTIFSMLRGMSAIVTEHGGMLSHAAILARELEIPCIVGVFQVTKTIKTGDFIFVDAFKGIVEKVK